MIHTPNDVGNEGVDDGIINGDALPILPIIGNIGCMAGMTPVGAAGVQLALCIIELFQLSGAVTPPAGGNELHITVDGVGEAELPSMLFCIGAPVFIVLFELLLN